MTADNERTLQGAYNEPTEPTTTAECTAGFRPDEVNWLQRLSVIKDAPSQEITRSLLAIQNAERHASLQPELITQFVLLSFRNTVAYYEKEVASLHANTREDPLIIAALLRRAEPLKVAHAAELSRMEADHEYTYRWYQEQNKLISAATAEITSMLNEYDKNIAECCTTIDRRHIRVQDRITLLNEQEFEEYMYQKYGFNDFGIDEASSSHGQTTAPEYNKARRAYVKLIYSPVLTDITEPMAGVRIVINTVAAAATARHESLHLGTDLLTKAEIVDTPSGQRYLDRRGFRERYLYCGDGTYAEPSSLESALPLLAIDEGTVVFLERYFRLENSVEQTIASLDGKYQGLSEGYLQAARIIGRIVRILGIDALITHYFSGNPTQFIDTVTTKMGSYLIEELKAAQTKM